MECIYHRIFEIAKICTYLYGIYIILLNGFLFSFVSINLLVWIVQ